MDGLGPVSRYRHGLEDSYVLISELADELGVGTKLIHRRCFTNPHLAPARIGRYGGRDVWLFTPEEAEAIRVDIANRPVQRGRPRIWSEEEVLGRKRLRWRWRYWSRRAELDRCTGRPERAANFQARADAIALQLRTQRPASLD